MKKGWFETENSVWRAIWRFALDAEQNYRKARNSAPTAEHRLPSHLRRREKRRMTGKPRTILCRINGKR
jgi:hypothetical protein